MKLIVAILIAAAVFWLIRLMYRKTWDEGLQVEVAFPDRVLREGDKGTLQEVITNDKFLPLPILQIKFAITRTFRFAKDAGGDVTDQYYRNEYFTLKSYERVTRTYPFTCTRRGLFTMKNMDLICKDLFMSEEMYASIEHKASLLVMPRRVHEREIPSDCLRLLGEIETDLKLQEDPFAFSMIREYQPYDSMHAVNWKVSARMDKLMVNTFRTTVQRELVIILDLNTHAQLQEDLIREELIRIAATLCAYFVGKKIPTGLLSNGCDILSHEPESVRAGADEAHVRTIEMTLGRIDTKQPCPDILPILKERMRLKNHEEILLLTNDRKDTFLDELRALRNGSDKQLYMINAFLKREPQKESCDFAIPWEIIHE
ncbi:MAG: DUF58 domain-containing protein [Lachnospiraceae bacterium]|nr:DUF58 domain-containing protein [Lachnospiraceae bacterium]